MDRLLLTNLIQGLNFSEKLGINFQWEKFEKNLQEYFLKVMIITDVNLNISA